MSSNGRRHPIGAAAIFIAIWRHRQLIWQMSRREVMGRYRGSALGLAWSMFNPLLMLAVYTLVFSAILKAKWGISAAETKEQFATIMFIGLAIHGLFSEVLNKAPTLVIANLNYVKKIVFPLEILPIVSMASAIFHYLVSLLVLLVFVMAINGFLYWTVLLVPVVVLPLILLTLGLAWLLASLGVYLRDVAQGVGIVSAAALFLAPVFYPVTAVPDFLYPWLLLNPLTFIIEQARAVIFKGVGPDWWGLAAYCGAALAIAWAGFYWFQKTRKGFADVV